MEQINLKNINYCTENQIEIFKNLTLNLNVESKIGLVGRNGVGKTTFLQIVLGEIEYQGEVISNLDFEYFPNKIINDDEIALNFIKEDNSILEDWLIVKEANKLELAISSLYLSLKKLSGGELTKVLLLKSFLKDNKFYLLDEPTNHLDLESTDKIADYLREQRGFIVISHNRKFLDLCTDKTLVILNNSVYLQQGSFSSWLKNKEKEDQYSIKENEKLKREIRALKKEKEQTKNWSNQIEKSKIGAADKGYIGHKSAKMMKRSIQSKNKLNERVEKKKNQLIEVEEVFSLKLSGNDFRKTLRIDLDGVEFEVVSGEKIALVGPNGSGKSTFLKKLLVDLNIKTSYLAQSSEELSGELKSYITDFELDETLFKTILRKLNFKRAEFKIDLKKLSSGKKRLLEIARSLSEKAELYIWDEPLNYIDIFTREQIKDLISTTNSTILFVEHDSYFIKSTADKIIEINKRKENLDECVN